MLIAYQDYTPKKHEIVYLFLCNFLKSKLMIIQQVSNLSSSFVGFPGAAGMLWVSRYVIVKLLFF